MLSGNGFCLEGAHFAIESDQFSGLENASVFRVISDGAVGASAMRALQSLLLTEFQLLGGIVGVDAACRLAIVMPACKLLLARMLPSAMREVALRGMDVVDGLALGGGGDAPRKTFLFLLVQVSSFPAPDCLCKDTSYFRRILQQVFVCF